MATRRNFPEPKPPTISQADGKRRLEHARNKGKAMLDARPISPMAYEAWENTTREYIAMTFGEASDHLDTFRGQVFVSVNIAGYGNSGNIERETEARNAKDLLRQLHLLDALIAQIDSELLLSSPPPTTPQQEDYWSRLHPSVTEVAKPRFDGGHYADAVEAAFKELNFKIKEVMKRATGKELDGADLMRTAFSPNNPTFRLGDLSSKDGKSTQQGYMDIFAGSMTGIRNPKAHSNVKITAPRAIHFLHLASLLHFVFDERI